MWDWALQYSKHRRDRFTQPIPPIPPLQPLLNGNLNTNPDSHRVGLPTHLWCNTPSSGYSQGSFKLTVADTSEHQLGCYYPFTFWPKRIVLVMTNLINVLGQIGWYCRIATHCFLQTVRSHSLHCEELSGGLHRNLPPQNANNTYTDFRTSPPPCVCVRLVWCFQLALTSKLVVQCDKPLRGIWDRAVLFCNVCQRSVEYQKRQTVLEHLKSLMLGMK